jgi:hypothetical protein
MPWRSTSTASASHLKRRFGVCRSAVAARAAGGTIMIGAVVEVETLQFVREIMSVRTGEPLSIGSCPEMDKIGNIGLKY